MTIPHQDNSIDDEVTHYVRDLDRVSHLLIGSTVSVTVLGHGYNNKIYEITTDTIHLVLKVYPHGREDRMYREYAALQLLESVDAVPQVVWGEPNARFLYGIPFTA